MPDLARVTIHSSQFPEQVRRDLQNCLRQRQVNHKFHYDTVKQAQKWLALHERYSPSRNDPDCRAVYERSFEAFCQRLQTNSAHLVGLGCGGGQKDCRLLQLLARKCRELYYTPLDVSTALVLIARQVALSIVPERNCFPIVCDIGSADDLPETLEALGSSATLRIFTFFGMIPNFESQHILPKLASLIGPSDTLLFSANLAPGPDYSAGIEKIFPLYDNALTRDWLMSFLLDCGIETNDGNLKFSVEHDPSGYGLKRIAAHFHFSTNREIEIAHEKFRFAPGDSIRLFFSYRHTPAMIRSLLDRYALNVCGEWVTQSQEEGVFLVRRREGT
jgi:uncharacterized SAM-dependent methyltransferase